MELSIEEEFAARAIGTEALKYLKEAWTPEKLASAAEGRAVRALEDVRRALDDNTLDDPACFHRIQAILNALEKYDIYSARHDI